MKKLSSRNKALLLSSYGATFKERYMYIEESLYVKDAKIIFEFCEWIDENIGGAGTGNIDTLFLAFRNPKDESYQAKAMEVKSRIASLNKLLSR